MALYERKLWWHKCLHSLVIEKQKKVYHKTDIKILDDGCGTAGMLSVLHENGYYNCEVFDLSDDAVECALKKFSFNHQSLNILKPTQNFRYKLLT